MCVVNGCYLTSWGIFWKCKGTVMSQLPHCYGMLWTDDGEPCERGGWPRKNRCKQLICASYRGLASGGRVPPGWRPLLRKECCIDRHSISPKFFPSYDYWYS